MEKFNEAFLTLIAPLYGAEKARRIETAINQLCYWRETATKDLLTAADEGAKGNIQLCKDLLRCSETADEIADSCERDLNAILCD